jgi:hypothetical protein
LRASTEDLLDEVASVDGAVGYAELGLAQNHPGVTAVNIDNFPASTDIAVHQGYPFWQTEFARRCRIPCCASLPGKGIGIHPVARSVPGPVGSRFVRPAAV